MKTTIEAICKKIANEESKNMENGERVWDYGFKCAIAAFKAGKNYKKEMDFKPNCKHLEFRLDSIIQPIYYYKCTTCGYVKEEKK